MKYDLSIRDYNLPAHFRIEKELGKIKNGLFTFTLRVNGGNIVDCVVVDYVDVKSKYFGGKQVTFEEHSITRYRRERS